MCVRATRVDCAHLAWTWPRSRRHQAPQRHDQAAKARPYELAVRQGRVWSHAGWRGGVVGGRRGRRSAAAAAWFSDGICDVSGAIRCARASVLCGSIVMFCFRCSFPSAASDVQCGTCAGDCESSLRWCLASDSSDVGHLRDRKMSPSSRRTVASKAKATSTAAVESTSLMEDGVPLLSFTPEFLADPKRPVGSIVSDMFAVGRTVTSVIDVRGCAVARRCAVL